MCRAYPDTGTGTSEDVFYLLAIRGPTSGEGNPGIEPGSSDPQSSPLPLRHRGGVSLGKRCFHKLIEDKDDKDIKKNQLIPVMIFPFRHNRSITFRETNKILASCKWRDAQRAMRNRQFIGYTLGPLEHNARRRRMWGGGGGGGMAAKFCLDR